MKGHKSRKYNSEDTEPEEVNSLEYTSQGYKQLKYKAEEKSSEEGP